MVVRWPLPLAIVALMAVPASAADESISAMPTNEWDPPEVTIEAGDTVTFDNAGGFHNVKFDDGSFEQPADPSPAAWEVERTFDKPGTFRFYCEQHGGPNGVGMAGKVTVTGPDGEVPDPVTPPGLAVAASAKQGLAKVLKRGVRARTHCEGGCDATLKATLAPKTAKRLGFRKRRTTIGTAKASLDPSGTRNVDVALTGRAKRKLRAAERAFKVRLDVSASRDTTETARRTITVTP